MKVNYKVPKKFADVLLGDSYTKNTRYSVTQLLKEPRAVILEHRHGDKVEPEIEDRLWSFFGTAFHDAMEAAEDDNSIIEERLKHGNVSGKFDHYDAKEKTVYDFKFTSVWTLVFDDEFKDNQKQLSTYAALLEESGFEVRRIKNILIFRDWKESEYIRGKYSIPNPYAELEFDILHEIDGVPILDWVEKREKLFDTYLDTPDDELPYCSEEFRWAKPDTYAVKKNKNKTASKVFDNKPDADAYVEAKNGGKDTYFVEQRQGEKFKRCQYCNIKNFCNQYKSR